MHRLLAQLWYRSREPLLWRLLALPLWLLSLLFGLVVRARRAWWKSRAIRLPARVISVGNLTVGGAGKTPVVIHLARKLAAQGERVAVLSRGYGGTAPGPLIVGDGHQLLRTAGEAGDEPVLIARACPGVAVVIGRDRVEAGRLAIKELGATTLLLDDGLQHLRLARDLDVVVVDASNPFGNGQLMPRGPLREPRSALKHAGLVWLSKADQADAGALETLAQQCRRRTSTEPVQSGYAVADVTDSTLTSSFGSDALAGRRVLLCAGLARPDSFRQTLRAMGADIAGEALFADHHRFTPTELASVESRRAALGADFIAMTEKDAVRLAPDSGPALIRVVRIEVRLLADAGFALLQPLVRNTGGV